KAAWATPEMPNAAARAQAKSTQRVTTRSIRLNPWDEPAALLITSPPSLLAIRGYAEKTGPRPQQMRLIPTPRISAGGPSSLSPATDLRSELDLPAAAARFMSRSKVHRTWAFNRESEAAPML